MYRLCSRSCRRSRSATSIVPPLANASSQPPGGEEREPPVRCTAPLDTWTRSSKDLVDPKIDTAGLRCLSALPQEQLDEVDPALQYRHQIAAIHENHQPAARGVSPDAILRETIDRQEEPERVVEFAGQLASENVEIGCPDRLLLPLAFKQIVRGIKGKGAINLLADNLKGSTWVQVEQLEQGADDRLQPVPALLRLLGPEQLEVLLFVSPSSLVRTAVVRSIASCVFRRRSSIRFCSSKRDS